MADKKKGEGVNNMGSEAKKSGAPQTAEIKVPDWLKAQQEAGIGAAPSDVVLGTDEVPYTGGTPAARNAAKEGARGKAVENRATIREKTMNILRGTRSSGSDQGGL